MKFAHIADMHFDAPFTSLAEVSNLGDVRRLEQRNVFKKVINYIKENNIKYLFISGDLYENEYVKKSTIIYINELFKEIPNTKIFISPGNHDPYLKNSYYATFNFENNVYIFKDKFETIETEDFNVYGIGFVDFYNKGVNFNDLKILNNGKKNVLVIHGSLDSGSEDNKEYNPMSKTFLKTLGFDYIALGHIHKTNYNEENNILYPGSLISLGFDELGEHGMLVGDFGDKLKVEFIKLDEREFVELNEDVQRFNSKEDLIEYINFMELDENKLYKLILVGKRNFEINRREYLSLINKSNILKIKDLTKLNYDINEMAKENTLRGVFVKEILEKLNSGEYTQEEIEKAIEIGLKSI